MAMFEVELRAFKQGQIRQVEVPDKELVGKNDLGALELIFKYGQNDFQPMQLPSVSMGDIVRYGGKRHLVLGVGFSEVPNDYSLTGMEAIMEAMRK